MLLSQREEQITSSCSSTVDFFKNQISSREKKCHNHFWMCAEIGPPRCHKGGCRVHASCSADLHQHSCLSKGCVLAWGVAVQVGWHQEEEEKLQGTGSKALAGITKKYSEYKQRGEKQAITNSQDGISLENIQWTDLQPIWMISTRTRR